MQREEICQPDHSRVESDKPTGKRLPAVLLDPWDLYNQYVRIFLFGRGAPELRLPEQFFPYVLAAGLLLAAILTYHELQTGVGRNKQIVQKLKDIYLLGDEFVNRKITNDDEFNAYEKEMFDWANSASAWVASNMGDAASSLFRDRRCVEIVANLGGLNL